MHILINRAYNKNSDELLRKAIFLYCQEKNAKDENAYNRQNRQEIQIVREDGKKPYIKDSNIKFNISHTGDIFVCAIDDTEVGIDVQATLLEGKEKYQEEQKLYKLSEKYFTENEHSFIMKNGTKAFFDIWTYKEAYTKLLGKSIFYAIKNIETVEAGELRDVIGDVYMTRICIHDASNIVCAVASYRKDTKICLGEI